VAGCVVYLPYELPLPLNGLENVDGKEGYHYRN
jgi:hypothetical protein